MKTWRDRYVTLVSLGEHAKGIEIGVYRGENSFNLLDKLPGIKTLTCVDKWSHYDEYTRYPEAKKGNGLDYENVYSDFSKKAEQYGSRIEVIKKTSLEAAEMFEDETFDFVFIDANHRFKYVIQDLKAWWPKVKKGGLFSGHDYVEDKNSPRYGVTMAVNKFFPKGIKKQRIVWYKRKEDG